MAYAAPAQHQSNAQNEVTGVKISLEDMEKLQEIHELINLLFAELTTPAPSMAPPPYLTPGLNTGHTTSMMPGPMQAIMPGLQPGPYTHSLFQYAWGSSPFLRPPGY
jgi:hypothetical protein